MTMTDVERAALHNKLTDVLGTKEASKLMEHLPPTGWDQLVTKDDLEASEQRLGTRIDGTNERLDQTNERLDQTNVHLHELGMQLVALRGEFGELRGEFGELRGEFREGMTALRGEFREGMTALRGEFREEMTALRGEFNLTLVKHFRQTIYAVMGFTLAMWGPVVVMLLS
jgi:chromosome segregation ATPase